MFKMELEVVRERLSILNKQQQSSTASPVLASEKRKTAFFALERETFYLTSCGLKSSETSQTQYLKLEVLLHEMLELEISAVSSSLTFL